MQHPVRPILVLGLLAIAAWGCAEERPPINRVQPYALDKTLFVGTNLADPKDNPEFYAQATLIDVGYGASQDGLFTSTYAQPLSRIKFQITQNLLIGRLAYERIEGTDGKGAGKATNDGVIVCAYPITSHFDIRKSYNPTTGEELNVLEENAFDRPWYERRHMRVDWSRNLNTDSYDFDTLSMVGIYGGVQYESMAFDINDPNDENAPYFAKDGSYFDVTNKAFARPKLIDLSHLGWGIDKFPACMLPPEFAGGTEPAGNCNPVELTIRQAFKRVEDTDFEPTEYDGYRFQAYGIFTTERNGYARSYGMTDDRWHRFADKYNIWQRSHYYKDPAKMLGEIKCFVPQDKCTDKSCVGTPYGADPNRDADKNGTADECEAAGLGSRCDTFKQRCTLPYAKRTEKPVVWYYASGSSQDYFGATEDATHEWDVAMRAAVVTAKYAECAHLTKGQEGKKNECATAFPMYRGQMEDHWDLVQLAREVDDCRHGVAYKDNKRDEAKCAALADTLGKKRGLDAGIIALAKAPEMVVLCHSPVEANDPDLCGPKDARLPPTWTAMACAQARQSGDWKTVQQCNKAVHARRGDLRYHAVNAMVAPQTPSPWGIMVDADDPLSGEVVSASINVWTHVNDLFSQGLVDQARYIAKELKTEEITNGTYIRDWSSAAVAAAQNGALGQLTADQVDEHVGDAAGMRMSDAQAQQFAEQHPKAVQLAAKVKEKLEYVTAADGAVSVSAPLYAARRQQAQGTAFEAALLTEHVQHLHGLGGMPMSQGVLNLASPLRGGNPSVQREFRRMRETALSERGACIMEMQDAPLSIAGLGQGLQEKFGKFDPSQSKDEQHKRADRMKQYLARKVHYAVIIHEMGHSIGLRHNFISSSDAMNYRPQYWQLRTSDGANTKPCTSLAKDGSACVGPRWFDPVTTEERDNLIWMWMHSSVMDYAGETTQDLLGLGAYDFAAARMFYGDTVAVYDDEKYKSNAARGKGALTKMDNFGGILGLQPKYNGADIHYSQLQKNYALINDCDAVEDVAQYKPARWNEATEGAWSPLLDGLLVTVNGATTKCKSQKVDYVPWTSLRQANASEATNYRAGPGVDPQGRVRVPYGFATDRWADLGNASVYRHDNGADQYEIFNFMVTMQEVGHIFDNYRRGRKSFSAKGAANRTLARYNEKMRDGAKGLGLYRNIYRSVAEEATTDADELWAYAAKNFFPSPMLAAGMVFDHFGRLLARPEPGPHFKDDQGVMRSMESKISNAVKPTAFHIPNGATGYFGNVAYGGKLVENQLADDKGEYDAEYTMNAGSYYDKMYVSMLLTESVDNFISSSLGDFTDARYRSVSMADLFPEAYRRMISNALTGDEVLKGPRVAVNAKGDVPVDAEQFPQQAIGWTSWIGATPKACFPGPGSTICQSAGSDLQAAFGSQNVVDTAVVDSQIGWEQQKFLIAWTMLYLPENQKQNWLDMMRVYELAEDASPTYASRIEFHDPTGKVFIARTYGRETLFGKVVEKGIAARVLQYANELLGKAYETTPGPDLNGDGEPDWLLPLLGADGQAVVKYDPAYDATATCGPKITKGCKCTSNGACLALQNYVEVPFFLRQAVAAYGYGGPKVKAWY
ncbi:MAG: hypothetical protein FJ100_08360 [Deltaproteobacteria bacterium]|nr:hypothetical protein [Deltaproteobacteria bacterium]